MSHSAYRQTSGQPPLATPITRPAIAKVSVSGKETDQTLRVDEMIEHGVLMRASSKRKLNVSDNLGCMCGAQSECKPLHRESRRVIEFFHSRFVRL
jgi:hypothetical protein